MATKEPPTAQEIVAQRKIEKRYALESEYLRAVKYIQSPKFQENQQKALAKIRGFIATGTKDQTQALYVLGRCQQVLEDTFAHEAVILEYEDLGDSLKNWGGTVRG